MYVSRYGFVSVIIRWALLYALGEPKSCVKTRHRFNYLFTPIESLPVSGNENPAVRSVNCVWNYRRLVPWLSYGYQMWMEWSVWSGRASAWLSRLIPGLQVLVSDGLRTRVS